MTKQKNQIAPVRFPVTTTTGREGTAVIDDGWVRVTATKGAHGTAEARLQSSAAMPAAMAAVLLEGLPSDS